MPDPQIEALKIGIANTVRIDGRVAYWQSGPYVRGIEALLPSFKRLLKDGKPIDAIALIEYTMELMESNWGKADDSDGGMSVVFKDLQRLHL